jgi:hypothetical protein
MIKTKFVTAIYSNLNGTEYGGRPSRKEHYRYSLLSLLRMTNADLVCYTSTQELNELEYFFYTQNGISKDKLKLIPFELNQSKYKEVYSKYKDIDSIKQGDRCFEIQYNKFFWTLDECSAYDYIYWIDAGLCHCGIIPDKYLINTNTYQRYFNSNYFDNLFLEKLITKTENKILIIGKSNVGSNYWSGTIPEKYYKTYDNTKHIIGGIFGGKKVNMLKFIELFENIFLTTISNEQTIYSEEQIMSLVYADNKELFSPFFFDVWWHEDNLTKDCPPNYLTINKSFYKVLEEIKE